MALHVPKAPGVPQMLKEGARVSLSIHITNNFIAPTPTISSVLISYYNFINLYKNDPKLRKIYFYVSKLYDRALKSSTLTQFFYFLTSTNSSQKFLIVGNLLEVADL